MHLHRGFGDAHLAGNLFVQRALRDLNQNRTLTKPADQNGARRNPLLVEHASGADQLPPADALAFSIAEFCRRHGISRPHFYNLSKSGDRPAVMRVGRRTLISAEAAAEWRRRMEQLARDGVGGASVDGN